jgi:hypothetical protein
MEAASARLSSSQASRGIWFRGWKPLPHSLYLLFLYNQIRLFWFCVFIQRYRWLIIIQNQKPIPPSGLYVLRAGSWAGRRSRRRGSAEVIGSAMDQICSWFQVSGVSNYRTLILNTDLVATEGQHRWKKVHFMSGSDTAGRIRLLKFEHCW